MEHENSTTINPHELAKAFEAQIKKTVADRFEVSVDELELLLNDENGVYLSQEESGTLCCFVLGQKNGYLFLVTGKIGEDGKSLLDFKSDVIS